MVEPVRAALLNLSIFWSSKGSTLVGNGCGSVGRGVASATRGTWFESSHRQNFIANIFTVQCRKDKNKQKRGRELPILKKIPFFQVACTKKIALHQEE